MNLKTDLNELLGKPVTLAEKFHHKTKIKKNTNINLNPKFWPESWKTVYFKAYSRFEEVVLPRPNLSEKLLLKDVFIKRRSAKEFSNIPLSLDELSLLLYYSAGLRNCTSYTANRFYPSAGVRYPLEIYIISSNIDSLSGGLYHYYLKNHSLERLLKLKDINLKKYSNQSWFTNTCCFVVITAVFKRTTFKYGDRGYRYILIEAGHLGQNLYLIAAALNLSCCAVGGFYDDKLNNLLDIDGKQEAVIYALAFGKKASIKKNVNNK